MKRWIHASSNTANIPSTKDGWIDYFQNNYFREYPDYEGLDDLADYLDGKEADTDWSYALEDYGADPKVVAALEEFVAKNQSAIEADDFLTDEEKEALAKADTRKWAAMQNDIIDEDIRRAGSYRQYIAKPKRDHETQIHGSEDAEIDEDLPEELARMKYEFELVGGNADWGHDIHRIAEDHGAMRVRYREINPRTGRFYANYPRPKYIVPDEETAEDIIEDVNAHGIPKDEASLHGISIYETDWDNAYNIRVENLDGSEEEFSYHSVPFNFKKEV